jgi:single-strand DNA-binding protein
VILVGNLGRDLETRHLDGGQIVCNFSLATHSNHKGKNGQQEKVTEWHRCVAWGKQAETAEKFFYTGMLVYVEGRIQTRDYKDKTGQPRKSFEIVASHFRMLGGKPDDAGSPDKSQSDDVASDADESFY